jgi:hypothetical protein
MSTWRNFICSELKGVQVKITRAALTEYLELLFDKHRSYIAVRGSWPAEFSTVWLGASRYHNVTVGLGSSLRLCK